MATEWNEKTGWFRKSFSDINNAALRLRALRKLVEDSYSELRTKLGGTVTGPALRAAVAAVNAPAALAPGLVELLDEHRAVLVSRGFRANTIKGYNNDSEYHRAVGGYATGWCDGCQLRLAGARWTTGVDAARKRALSEYHCRGGKAVEAVSGLGAG